MLLEPLPLCRGRVSSVKWPQIEFLFWDHWERAVLGQSVAGRSREVTGGHRRLREVTGGYGAGKWRTVEEEQEKGRRHPTKRTEMSSVKCRRGSVEWKVLCRV